MNLQNLLCTTFLAVFLSACVSTNINYEGLGTAGKGRVQISGSASYQYFGEDDRYDRYFYSGKIGYGIHDNIDVQAKFEHAQEWNNTLYNYVGVGSKIRVSPIFSNITTLGYGKAWDGQVTIPNDGVYDINRSNFAHFSHSFLLGKQINSHFDVNADFKTGLYYARQPLFGSNVLDRFYVDQSIGLSVGASSNLDRWGVRTGFTFLWRQWTDYHDLWAPGINLGGGIYVNIGQLNPAKGFRL